MEDTCPTVILHVTTKCGLTVSQSCRSPEGAVYQEVFSHEYSAGILLYYTLRRPDEGRLAGRFVSG
jgi:hypothetical protein